jgi:hypothetical protein
MDLVGLGSTARRIIEADRAGKMFRCESGNWVGQLLDRVYCCRCGAISEDVGSM